MKKITLSITLIMIAFFGFAQVQVSDLGTNNPTVIVNQSLERAPCSESNASNAFENGLAYAGVFLTANDLTVNPDEDFTLNQIVFNSFHVVGETISSVDVTYYDDNAGLPGTMLGSETVVPTSQTVVGNNFGFDVSEVVLDITPFPFAGQAGMPTTYWIAFSNGNSSGGGALFWEVSSASMNGNPTLLDDGSGSGWAVFDPTLDGVYTFNGDCTPLGGGCTNTTYTSTSVPFDIDGAGTSTADCVNAPNLIDVNVPDAGIIGTDADLDNVTIDISHTWSGDLIISLVSPSGTELILSDTNSGNTDDAYNGTMFQDGGADITAATAPYGVGPYAPEGGAFAATFAGESITGDWNLKVCDDAGGDTGSVNSFTITFCLSAQPPVNDLIANSIDLDAIGACPDYTDPAVAFPAATTEGGNPVDCNINGVNGVWYNITVDNDGWLFAEIITPAGISVVNFYEAPNENAVESDLTLVHYIDNQCAPQTDAMIPVVANTTYYLFVANTGGVSDVHITCDLLGVDDNFIEGFNFYPNPTNGELNLNADKTIENVTIFNVLGQKVLDATVDSTTSQINVSNLTTGTYFMKVTVDGQVGTYKILKQ